MATTIQIRRDSSTNWQSVNPILANGEFGKETDTGKIKNGDGVTAWNDLDYSGGESGMQVFNSLELAQSGNVKDGEIICVYVPNTIQVKNLSQVELTDHESFSGGDVIKKFDVFYVDLISTLQNNLTLTFINSEHSIIRTYMFNPNDPYCVSYNVYNVHGVQIDGNNIYAPAGVRPWFFPEDLFLSTGSFCLVKIQYGSIVITKQYINDYGNTVDLLVVLDAVNKLLTTVTTGDPLSMQHYIKVENLFEKYDPLYSTNIQFDSDWLKFFQKGGNKLGTLYSLGVSINDFKDPYKIKIQTELPRFLYEAFPISQSGNISENNLRLEYTIPISNMCYLYGETISESINGVLYFTIYYEPIDLCFHYNATFINANLIQLSLVAGDCNIYNNVNTLSTTLPSVSYTCNLKIYKQGNLTHNLIGTYCGGYITAFLDKKVKIFLVDTLTGSIIEQNTIDLEKISSGMQVLSSTENLDSVKTGEYFSAPIIENKYSNASFSECKMIESNHAFGVVSEDSDVITEWYTHANRVSLSEDLCLYFREVDNIDVMNVLTLKANSTLIILYNGTQFNIGESLSLFSDEVAFKPSYLAMISYGSNTITKSDVELNTEAAQLIIEAINSISAMGLKFTGGPINYALHKKEQGEAKLITTSPYQAYKENGGIYTEPLFYDKLIRLLNKTEFLVGPDLS